MCLAVRRSQSVNDPQSLSHMSDQIEISVRIRFRDLQHPQTSNENRFVCAVYENDSDNEDRWNLVGCSKPVTRQSSTIKFRDRFPLRYVFEKYQLIRINICSYNARASPTRLANNSIGACIFKLDELTGSFGLQLRKALHREVSIGTAMNAHRSLPSPVGGITITGCIPDKEQPIVIQFCGKSLEKKDFIWDETAVFFRVYRIEEDPMGEEDDQRVMLYESEAIKNHSHPQWKAFSLPTREVADDRNRLLEVWVFYRDVDNTEAVIGKFLTTYAKMKYGAGPDNVYNVINETKKQQKKNYDNSGRFELTKFTDVSFYSFLDYIVSGTQLHFEIAVDFSGHEQFSASERTKFDTDFILAMRAMGEIIRDYSPNRLFPAFGFGAKVPPMFQESHEFCLNFSMDPACRGLDGVTEAYRKAAQLIRSADQSFYAPIINYVTRLAQQHASGLHYHVLAIFTTGRTIDDYKDTLAALLSAAEASLSIILIGIGNGDFTHFQKLCAKKKHSPRDAVEFVEFSEVFDTSESISDNKKRICEQTLHSIPRHFLQHMHGKGIAAKPPIQVCRSPLFHSSFLIPDRPTEFHLDEIPSRFPEIIHPVRTDRRGSDSHYLVDLEDRMRNFLTVKVPERSHSALQTSREQYQRRMQERRKAANS
ncbi:unnamed protein product, partial [Mesorhabditis belari]|uniref:Copine C-terminal domain-containing protein n=1 Tax=Mesorhabditis belari TaxID=2138241 RepID=A0AAF3EY57_9BILA